MSIEDDKAQAVTRRRLLKGLRIAADGGDVVSGALLELVRRKVEGYRSTQDILNRLAETLGDDDGDIVDVA